VGLFTLALALPGAWLLVLAIERVQDASDKAT
jgi:hypothetical protein